MRIITWNTQGSVLSVGKLQQVINYDPDVICLQECGDLSPLLKEPTRKSWSLYYELCSFGTNSRKKEYHVFYYSWRNGSRCSMATLVKAEHDIVRSYLKYSGERDRSADYSWIPDSIYDFMTEEGFDTPSYEDRDRRGLRAMLQVIVDINGYGSDYLAVNNVHLPSGCPNYAMRVARNFFYKSRHFHSYSIVIGDMNIPAFMWKEKSIPYYRLYAPNTRTHSKGHILDYMFTDMTAPSQISVAAALHNSDHFWVVYDF